MWSVHTIMVVAKHWYTARDGVAKTAENQSGREWK